jgi:DNA-binding transcriptional LysR family regulator
LGVRLFDRTSRKVEITKFGQLLLPYAKTMVELEDEYRAVLQSNLASDQRILNLGSIRALAPYNITDIWVTFQKSRPQSTINLQQASSNELMKMLRDKQCELVFIRETGEADNDFVKINYSTDTMVAVLPITHSLAKQKSIPLKKLANQNLLLMDKYLYKLCTNACRANGFDPKVAHTDTKFENLIDLVIKGMGVALLMKQIPLYLSNPKIAVVEIAPPVTAQIILCYLKGAQLSDEAKHFILCTERYIESRTKA